MFKVTLQTSGEKHTKTAKSVNEALVKMNLTWNMIKAKGVITVSKGKKSYDHVFSAIKLRRIFGNKLTRALWSKRLEFFTDSEKETNVSEKLVTDEDIKFGAAYIGKDK